MMNAMMMKSDAEGRAERLERRRLLRAEPQWILVQTTPQGERAAVADIRRIGSRAYLPLRAVYRRRNDDKLPIKRWPAIPGYVLAKFPGPIDWFRLHSCRGVRGVLFLDGKPVYIPQSEVAAIMRSQRSMAYDAGNARAVRRAWIRGERNARRALAAERFTAGARVYDPATAVLARILEVTKHGTVKGVIECLDFEKQGKGRDLPVEFTDTEALRIVDE